MAEDLKVVINGGHSLGTPGKRSPDDEREWSFNNEIVKAAIAELKTYEGVQVKRADDPTGKRDVPLDERVKMANDWGADYYISYHNNAYLKSGWGTHTGTETYTQTGVKSAATLDFAKAIHRGMVRAFGLKDRGMKTANFQETRTTKMPCCLTEGAYMDSTIDIKKLRDKKVLQAAGRESIIEFAKYKKLKKKKVAVKPATPAKKPVAAKPTGLHKVIVDGKQEGVYGSDYNVVQAVERALKAGKKSIEIKEN